MICDICGKHNASLLIRRIIDGKAKELYVCGSCAKKHNLDTTDMNMGSALNAVFDNLSVSAQKHEAAQGGKRIPVCPACGTSLKQVQEDGVIGCALCFFYFRDTILKLMREVNPELFYLGNLPDQLETFSEMPVPVQHLKKEMEKAVKNENYELAAYFRDRIKESESYS